MTTGEKDAVRALACAYVRMLKRTDDRDTDAINAEIDNASQDLPWRRFPGRAAYLGEVAWRAALRWSLRP